MQFKDKIVLVTGGGTGIGKTTAQAFIDEGAQVMISGRRESVLQQTTIELGENACYRVADIANPGEAKTLVEATLKQFGKLDIIVNNAGVYSQGPLSDVSDETIEQVYRTNVFGPLALIREALPALRANKGSVVNVSSVLSQGVMAGTALYSSTKAAIDHATRTLAAELGPEGIRVNAVAPGMTATDMTAELRANDTLAQGIVAQTPLGRLGQPSEISNLILQLSEARATWVTGQVIQVSGGLML